MMIAEAIAKIQALADKAAPVQIVRDCPDRLLVRRPDGALVAHLKEFPARDYVAGSQADFIAQVLHLHQRVSLDDNTANSGVAMFDSGNMVAVLDETGYRLHRIRYAMERSAAFRALADLGSTFLSQGDMHRIMRTSLAGVAPTEFVTFLTNIKLTRSVESEGQIAVGSESIRRDVKAAMIGAGTIPERVRFATNVYVDHDGDIEWAELFEFALEIDYVNARLALFPLADCIKKARRRTDSRVVAELDKALSAIGVRAFMGRFEPVPDESRRQR